MCCYKFKAFCQENIRWKSVSVVVSWMVFSFGLSLGYLNLNGFTDFGTTALVACCMSLVITVGTSVSSHFRFVFKYLNYDNFANKRGF